jgi:D-alanyl-D-alanine carboxypeptidase
MKSEVSTSTRVVAILKKRNMEQFHRAEMEVQAGEPHRVVHFRLARIPSPDEFLAPRMSEADAITALRAKIDAAVAADQFSGAVLVARYGVPIFAHACGFADRERKILNTLDTRFQLASMGKMFTAVATLQLVQAGKLALRDSLGKIVPAYPNKNVASKVTVHHLLTHTGGTGDIFGPELFEHRLETRTLQDYVRLYGGRDLKFEPGSTWEYSNYGFLLLGIVIEQLTGQNYYDWVSAHVLNPAGMTSTAWPVEDRRTPGLAVGYTRKAPGAPWMPLDDGMQFYRGTSAGGGVSTVSDLLRFANAVQGNKLLDAKHTALLTTAKGDTPADRTYAYGFVDETILGVRCYGHGGGSPGTNGKLYICESGYTIAVLANLDPFAADTLADFINVRLPASGTAR